MKRPFRVFMTADAVGGVWQYALDLAEGLRPHDVELVLAVLGPAPSSDQQAMAEAAGIKLLVTGLPLDWLADDPSLVKEAGKAVALIAAEHRPDVVHLNSPALAAGARFRAPVVAVCHSCVATWWQAVRGGPLPEEFVWRTDLTRQGYEAADLLLAPTMAFARMTAQAYGLASQPLVVRNGRRFKPLAQDSQETFVFTAGRLWDEGKNLGTLDRAAARLSVPVLAAGPLQGPNGTRVEAHHVRALGRLTDREIACHLSGKPIFVSTALYEPFGLAVLEAAQAGCALVLSDIPTFRELWEGAAIFVPADDDKLLASTIQHLGADSTRRTRMGEAARERASRYTVEAMSAGVMAAYHSLISPGPVNSSLEEATI